jgi:integrase
MASTKTSDGQGSLYQRHTKDCPLPVDDKGRRVGRCKCPWQGAYVSGWRGDKPIRKRVTGKTRAAAATRLKALIDEVEAGRLPSGRVPTVEEWMTYWLNHIAAGKVRPGTLESYSTNVNRYIVPLLGDHRLDRLTPEHIDDAWATLATRKARRGGKTLSPNTVRLAHTVLSRALKVAQQRGLIMRNPATMMDGPKGQRTRADVLTKDQARAILDAAREGRNPARWSVALGLGLRQGEALGLRWSDVDMENGVVRVQHSLSREKGAGLVLGPTKTDKDRSIVLPGPLLAALKEHRATQNAERLAAGTWWTDTGHVFAEADGRPVDPKVDWRRWRDLLAAAGVPHVKLHSARHTAATMLLAMGVPIEVVAEILGHSRLEITRGYQHRVDDLHVAAAEKMAAAYWG